MLRSLCLKLAALCLSLISLAGPVSAQTMPYQPPLAQQNSFTDEALDQMFRKVDPNLKVSVEHNGSKTYAFRVNRKDGVVLLMSVNVAATKMTIGAVVSNAIATPLSEYELNQHMQEVNRKLAPHAISVSALKLDNSNAVFIATRQIDRGVTNETFVKQWNGFLTIATELRRETMAK